MEVKGLPYALVHVLKGITYLDVFYFECRTGCLKKEHDCFKLANFYCISYMYLPGAPNHGYYNIILVTGHSYQALLPLSVVSYHASCYAIKQTCRKTTLAGIWSIDTQITQRRPELPWEIDVHFIVLLRKHYTCRPKGCIKDDRTS